MALRATLLSANRLAGCVALSTYFPGDLDAVKGKLVETPVFQVSRKQVTSTKQCLRSAFYFLQILGLTFTDPGFTVSWQKIPELFLKVFFSRVKNPIFSRDHQRPYQCCGSRMFIPDPNFSITDPRSRVKNLSIFYTKNCF